MTAPRLLTLLCAFSTLGTASRADAADVAIHIENLSGAPLEGAIVYALPASPAAPARSHYIIDQVNRQFVPHVSVVQTGTQVSFPNSDNIRHSVYSFSPARVFNIKLYAGKSAQPVIFDKPGLVVLGCNIHDIMAAYLMVVDTPYFARTDRGGAATLAKLPAGEYTLRAWHTPLSEEQQVSAALRVEAASDSVKHTLRLNVPADPATQR